MTTTTPQSGYTGICVSPGIGIGRAFVYRKGTPALTRRRVAGHQVNLAVPAMQHTAVGPDGRRYSFFTAGQSFLAVPFYVWKGRLSDCV